MDFSISSKQSPRSTNRTIFNENGVTVTLAGNEYEVRNGGQTSRFTTKSEALGYARNIATGVKFPVRRANAPVKKSFTLTLSSGDDNVSKQYSSYKEAERVAERVVRRFKAAQRNNPRQIQLLNYVSIDSDKKMDLFYFDGSKLR